MKSVAEGSWRIQGRVFKLCNVFNYDYIKCKKVSDWSGKKKWLHTIKTWAHTSRDARPSTTQESNKHTHTHTQTHKMKTWTPSAVAAGKNVEGFLNCYGSHFLRTLMETSRWRVSALEQQVNGPCVEIVVSKGQGWTQRWYVITF